MKILFIHQNFPGQYKHLAARLSKDPGNQVVAIGMKSDHCRNYENIRHIWYDEPSRVSADTHIYVREFEAKIKRGEAVLKVCKRLKRSGFIPDVICVHTGWGEALYLKEVFIDVPVIGYFEFYYHCTGKDVGFDPEFPPSIDQLARVRTKMPQI